MSETVVLAIIAGVIGLMTTTATIVGSIFLAKINSKATATHEAAVLTKDATVETAKSVEKIHVAVNSEREKMVNEIRTLRDEILAGAKEVATLRERERERERES